MLSDKAVEEFRQIWKKKFGEELGLKEAREESEQLIRLFKVVYRPIPQGADSEGGKDV